MSQHDMVLDDASGAVFRADLNSALAAIATLNSGTSAPSTTYAYMWWADTTNGLLKQRNAANSAWVIRGRLASEGLVTKSSGFTVTLADYGKVFDCTAALTIAVDPAATLADGFWFGVRNSHGTGNVTVDPSSSELIDGSATRVFGPSESGLVYCSGAAFKTIGRHNQLIGDTGSGGTRGLVPAPAAGDAAANKYLKADGTWTAITIPSSSLISAGTPLVKNPYATSSTTTQAHGLGGAPHFFRVELECLSAELGHSIGDKIIYGGSHGGFSSNHMWQVRADATNVYLDIGSGSPRILNRSSYADAAMTAANWKVTVTPYRYA